VSDIATVGQTLLVSSLPLPLDPSFDDVPWYVDDKIVPLPNTSLANARGTAILQLVNNQNSNDANTGWLNQLVDSNVISATTQIVIDTSKTIEENMIEATRQLTANAVLSLQTLLRPPNESVFSDDTDYAFYDNKVPLNDTNIQIQYGVQNSFTSFAVAGSIIFAPQVNFNYVDIDAAAGSIPTFFEAGIDMDQIAKSFFVIDSIKSVEQTGLQKFRYLEQKDVETAPDGNIDLSYDFVGLTLRSNPFASPMWTNSIGYVLDLTIKTSNGYVANIKKPIDGPFSSLDNNEMSETDRAALNNFLVADVKRASPLIANLAISDMAYCREANVLAWSTYGPYNSQQISVGLLNVDGSVNEPLIYKPGTVDPQISGPVVMAWNPYELKIYVAGRGVNVYDWNIDGLPAGPPGVFIKPAGVTEDKWAAATWSGTNDPKVAKIDRLLILSSDLSSGAKTSEDYAQPFTQVYAVTKEGSQVRARVLSSSFNQVTCFGFSSNITAVGGSANLTDKVNVDGSPQTNAIVYWRQGISSASDDLKANWSVVTLGIGIVTAIKYVGYAWYIATWDPYANKDPVSGNFEGASTVYFASINFSAISPLDSWNTKSNNLYKITSIDSAKLGSGACLPGFEQDPDDPLKCVKKCPPGYTAFGTVCAQSCPGPYTETGVPNECKPDSFVPRTTAPGSTGNNMFTQGPKESPIQVIEVQNGINWTSLASISFIVILLVMVFLGFFIRR
jgi:hypothetical protein